MHVSVRCFLGTMLIWCLSMVRLFPVAVALLAQWPFGVCLWSGCLSMVRLVFEGSVVFIVLESKGSIMGIEGTLRHSTPTPRHSNHITSNNAPKTKHHHAPHTSEFPRFHLPVWGWSVVSDQNPQTAKFSKIGLIVTHHALQGCFNSSLWSGLRTHTASWHAEVEVEVALTLLCDFALINFLIESNNDTSHSLLHLL